MKLKPPASDLAYVSLTAPGWVATPGEARAYLDKRSMKLFVKTFAVIARRRTIFFSVLAIGLLAIIVLLRVIPKTYAGTARVLIVAANVGRDPSVASIDLPALATSTVVLTDVVHKLKLPVDLLQLKKRVRAGVKARSSIMDIDYRDDSPARAVAVPNAIADKLVSYYDTISSGGSDVTIRKLDVAISAVAQRLRSVDNAISAQAKRHPFVQSDKSLENVASQLDDLTAQRKLASATLAGDVAQRGAVFGDPEVHSRTVRYEKLQNDLTYHELATGISKDEAALAFMKTQYTEKFPGLRDLEDKVKAERAASVVHTKATLTSPGAYSLSEATSSTDFHKADAAVAGDRAKLHAIDALLARANDRLADTLDAGVASERLRLQQDSAKADYLTLGARRAAAIASRAEALSLGSLVVVDRAVRADTAVVGLGAARLGAVLIVFLVALAVVASFVADAFDSRLQRADQIEKLYGLPLLGLINLDS